MDVVVTIKRNRARQNATRCHSYTTGFTRESGVDTRQACRPTELNASANGAESLMQKVKKPLLRLARGSQSSSPTGELSSWW
jgi:hypothetical protein